MSEFLRAICEDKFTMSDCDLHQIAKNNGVDLFSQDYRILLVASSNRVDSPESYRRYCVDMPARCCSYFRKKHFHAEITSDYSGRCIILLMEKASSREIEGIINGMLTDLDRHSIPGTVVAVGKHVQFLEKVSHSYRTAVNALNCQSMYSGERCLFCEDMQVMMNLSTLHSVIDPNQMLQAFREDDMFRLRALAAAYAEKVRAMSGDSIEGRHPTSIRRMFVELTVYVLHMASDIGVDVDVILKGIDPYTFLLANDKSTPSIIDWFIGMCSELRDAMNEKMQSKEKNVIQRVCAYIDQNVTRIDLSLEDVAADVNIK